MGRISPQRQLADSASTGDGVEPLSTEELRGRRILAAKSTKAAARILVEEEGFDPGSALEAAAIMRGESQGDVIDPYWRPER